MLGELRKRFRTSLSIQEFDYEIILSLLFILVTCVVHSQYFILYQFISDVKNSTSFYLPFSQIGNKFFYPFMNMANKTGRQDKNATVLARVRKKRAKDRECGSAYDGRFPVG